MALESDRELVHRDQVGEFLVQTWRVTEENEREGQMVWVETEALLDGAPAWGDCHRWEGNQAELRQHVSVAAAVEGREAPFRMGSAMSMVENAERALDDAQVAFKEALPRKGLEGELSALALAADVESAEVELATAQGRMFRAEVAEREWEAQMGQVLTAHGIKPGTWAETGFKNVVLDAALALQNAEGRWAGKAAEVGAHPQAVSDAPNIVGAEGASRLVVVKDAAEAIALWQHLKRGEGVDDTAILFLGGPVTDHKVDWIHDEVRVLQGPKADLAVRVEVSLPESDRAARRDLCDALRLRLPDVEVDTLAPERQSWVRTVEVRERDWIRKQGIEPTGRDQGRGLGL